MFDHFGVGLTEIKFYYNCDFHAIKFILVWQNPVTKSEKNVFVVGVHYIVHVKFGSNSGPIETIFLFLFFFLLGGGVLKRLCPPLIDAQGASIFCFPNQFI